MGKGRVRVRVRVRRLRVGVGDGEAKGEVTCNTGVIPEPPAIIPGSDSGSGSVSG